MKKLNESLMLVANLSVVLGIIFLGVELRQNTRAIQAQTRDAITDKQMDYYALTATDRPLAELVVRIRNDDVSVDDLDAVDRFMFGSLWRVIVREWENSHYQYERGLFTPEEFEARLGTWRQSLATRAFRENWENQRSNFSPSFRAEVDGLVSETGQAR
jgi:hypothetical protein